jgi:Asp-tRNA(Asn)/Glu-tRNA(Gln) amidotransferase B subunit
MSKNKQKTHIRKALESISNGNAKGLKSHIREALFSKIKYALAAKEKQIAKNLIESTNISEDYRPLVKVAKSHLAHIEKSVSSNKKEAANAAKDLVNSVTKLISKVPKKSLATDTLEDDAKELSTSLSSGKFSSKEKTLINRISNLLSHPLSLDEE